jgi:hypothetical protein
MDVIVIDSKAYEKLKQELFDFLVRKMEENALLSKNSEKSEEWLSVKDTMHFLQVGRTKLQELKNHGEIDFTQKKKKLLFHRKSLERYLKKYSTL